MSFMISNMLMSNSLLTVTVSQAVSIWCL